MAKKTPALNTSSTADIAFLLLCYFLMTTTMGTQTGLQRRLPPMPDKNQKVEDQKVNKRNDGRQPAQRQDQDFPYQPYK